METMYPGKAFSPFAMLSAGIGATDTNITVSDASVFPPAPNIATIGIDETAETILYAAKAGNVLSGCTRGLEGAARSWPSDSVIGRNFTNHDYATVIANIRDLDQNKASNAELNAVEDIANAAIPASQKGQPNGTATLDAASKVPVTNLPAASASSAGTMSGADFTKLAGVAEGATKLALGETSTTAHRGDHGKTAYDHSQTKAANPHGTTASQIPVTPPPGMTATDTQAAVEELFTSASSGKAVVAGAVGSPATATNTFAQLAGHINDGKATLAANLTEKGVNALSTEALAVLAAKVLKIETGGGGFSRIEEVWYIASQTITIPTGCNKIDICLGGGGGGGALGTVSTADVMGGGYGGSFLIQLGIQVTPGQNISLVIGAGGAGRTSTAGNGTAGSATSMLGFSASGGQGGVNGALTPSTLRRVWDAANGARVLGNGAAMPTINGIYATTRDELVGGGGLSNGSGAVAGVDGTGGGGGYIRTATASTAGKGGSGFAVVRYYYQD